MLRKLIFPIVIVFCLCSCSSRGVKVSMMQNEYETDYSTVKTEIPQITGMEDTEFEAALNSGFSDDTESAVIAFDTEAAQCSDNVRMGNKCVFETSWSEKYNKNDFLSLVEERYMYTGGAHGETARLPVNIDIAGSKEIELGDLFEDEGYVSTLNRMISEMAAQNAEYSDLWEKPEIKESNQRDFYLTDDSLVIFYQPYDLSYYARGFVEFPLPLTELSGYMKEEYRRLVPRMR